MVWWQIIITVAGGVVSIAAIVDGLIKGYQKLKPKYKSWRKKLKRKKLELEDKKPKDWIVGLRLKATGLIYQRGVVRCSREDIVLATVLKPLHSFRSGDYIDQIFSGEHYAIIEQSEEVAYDAWDEEEFDYIIDL